MLTLNELLNELRAKILTLTNCRASTICTYENLLLRIAESHNEYMHVFIVYDLKSVLLREWSTELPLTLVICDKLQAKKTNEINVHSNTLSLSIEVIKILRQWAQVNGWDGINDTPTDVWTEDEGDALLGGVKLDIIIKGNIGGYCDIITD